MGVYILSRRRVKKSGKSLPALNRQQRRDRELNQTLNEFFAPEPSNVDGQFNLSSLFYRERLLLLVYALFNFKNVPKDWDMDYFREHLFLDGMICITDTVAGVLPLRTGVAGHNVFNRPTECIIANPVLGNLRRTINENCVLMKLQYNYCGIGDIINRYAYLLATCDASVAVNLINSKVSFICGAESEKQAKEMLSIIDRITAGEPAVVTDPENKMQISFLPVKNSFVANDIMEVKRTIINEFLTQIGVPNANTDKKERLITDEVNSNNLECRYYLQNWFDNINDAIERSNKMFDIGWSMELRSVTVAREIAEQISSSQTMGGQTNVLQPKQSLPMGQ